MSSPTPYTQTSFRPSRPAPPPPIYSLYAQEQHPTPSYQSRSTSSLDSFSTLHTPEKAFIGINRHTSPTSPLNTPLSTPRSTTRRTHSYPLTTPASPNTSTSTTSSPTSSQGVRPVYYSTPHSDLGLFDHRQRQNLLGDIECILGKKLHFPFLSKKDKSQSKSKSHLQSGSEAGSEKGHTKSGSGSSQEGNKLKKEKRISEDDLFWSGVRMEREKEEVVVINSESRRVGRGVREGNWI